MAERTQFRFGLVGYGEIGSTLGAGLRGAGLERITCYDKYAFDGPYADLIQGRAREAGVTLVHSNAELAEAADLIVSVTPGVASLESAEAFAPVLRDIPDPLQIGVNANHREYKAEVDGHRLLHREQVQRHLIDLALKPIDGRLRTKNQFADAEIAAAIGLNRSLDGLLCHASHDEQALLEVIEILLKFNPCHPNLPVM